MVRASSHNENERSNGWSEIRSLCIKSIEKKLTQKIVGFGFLRQITRE